MTNLEKAKEVIKEYFELGNCGLYDCGNYVCDPMSTIYENDDITIKICYSWSYFEVFGLSYKEFSELHDFYEKLQNNS